MCLWCLDPACKNGEKCRNSLTQSPLTGSRTFQNARRRITQATDRPVQTSPGTLWDGRRPAFPPGVRDAVMKRGDPCGICGHPISGRGHADHIVPWLAYTQQAADQAMAEKGKTWTGGPMPDDFVRVMSGDPKNLQPSHARCNEQKSDSRPGQRAGSVRRARREAERKAAEERRRKEEERAKKRAELWRSASSMGGPWDGRHRRGPGPGGAGGGGAGAVPA